MSATQVTGAAKAIQGSSQTLPPKPSTKVTQWRVVRSEWTKLWSLRSTRYALAFAVIAGIGFALIGAYVTAHQWNHLQPQDRMNFDPIGRSLDGVFFAQLAIGVLGVLMISGEYATGMVRATFSAVPKRLPVLWAKIATFAVTTFTLMLATAFIAFLGAQHFFAERNVSTSLGEPGTWRAIFGAAAYLTLIGIIGVGLGTILRSTAGGITALAGLLFVIQPVLFALPRKWNDHISPYLPSRAGESLFSGHKPDPTSLTPGDALITIIIYAIVFVVLAAIRLRRSDV